MLHTSVMAKADGIEWPPLTTLYSDEFGPIDPAVYEEAGRLWPRAERLSLSTLHDAPAGLRLMLKVAAAVTRVRSEDPTHIGDLRGYLFRSFKRLLLAELETQNGHRSREQEAVSRERAASPNAPAAEVERKILVQQLIGRMDEWTRRVFELRVIGYSFDEIGRMCGQNGHAVGKRFREQTERLRKRLAAEGGLTWPEPDL